MWCGNAWVHECTAAHRGTQSLLMTTLVTKPSHQDASCGVMSHPGGLKHRADTSVSGSAARRYIAAKAAMPAPRECPVSTRRHGAPAAAAAAAGPPLCGELATLLATSLGSSISGTWESFPLDLHAQSCVTIRVSRSTCNDLRVTIRVSFAATETPLTDAATRCNVRLPAHP